jgi:hypothetical protein
MSDSRSVTFWGRQCQAAFSTPAQTNILHTHSSHGLTVSRLSPLSCLNPVNHSWVREQVTIFFLSAVFNGTAFFLWRRIEAEDRLRLWQLYGWFTCLSCLGSFFGVFSMTASMQSDVSLYNNELAAQRYWIAAHVTADICEMLNSLCLFFLTMRPPP